MSNIISEFEDTQKFNPMGFDDADNGSILFKSFSDSVAWFTTQLPSAIKTVDPTAVPPGETTGNIYILHNNSGTVHANWDGNSKNDVVYFNGTSWIGITPVAGVTCYDKERNCMAKFDGSKWLYEECYAEITIPFLDVRAGTAVDVASPIANTDLIQPYVCGEFMDYGGHDYTGTAYIGLYMESGGSPLMGGSTGFIANSADSYENMYTKDAQALVKGEKLQAKASAVTTDGDSPITLFVKYRIIQG